MIQKTTMRAMLVLLALLMPALAQAQPLIDRVPADAMIYVGWRGAEDMGPAYEGSNLQGVIEQTGLLNALPQLFEAIRTLGEEEGEPEMVELFNAGSRMWEHAWEKGAAVYMLPPEDPEMPLPRLTILWQAGANNAELRDALSRIVETINEMEMFPAFMGGTGEALYLSIGFDAGEVELAGGLATQAAYTSAMKEVQADAALTVYANVQQFIAQADQAVEQQAKQAEEWGEPADPFTQLWPTLRDVSGLSGVNRLMLTAGIVDKSWQTQLYLDAPAPRTGILTLIDNEPIEDVQLTHVPKGATFLQAATLDPSRVMEVARDILSAVDEGMVEDFEDAMAEANEQVGINIEADLVNGLGPYWTIYIDPMVSGNGFTSVIIVNELRDADKVAASLNTLVKTANDMMAEELDDGPIHVRFQKIDVRGTAINYLGIPYIAPAWMVHDGKLYMALFPQALEMALEHSGKPEDSILANEAFQKTMTRLGEWPRTGLTFSDLPETAPDGYGMNMLIMQAFTGFAEMINGEPSAMRLPPIGKLMPFIEPAGSITWVDDSGLHITSIEPFPGSFVLGPAKGVESTLAISAPLAIGIMLPALGSAREAAHRAEQLSQGRQIATAAVSYAIDHENQMPDDIAALIEYLGDTGTFISPRSMRAQDAPFNFAEWEEARQHRFIRENSSYVLVPVGDLNKLANAGETILLFQRPDDNPAADSYVVAWADGHTTTEWDLEWLEARLKEQTGKTLDQLVERQVQFGE